MSEEIKNESEVQNTASAPVAEPAASVSAPTAAAPTASPLWRDLLIPVSIVVAGVFIGGGLYLSGGSGGGSGFAGAASGGPTETFQEKIVRLAKDAGVKEKDFNACMEDSSELATRVQEDADNAAETGGGGTPWSIVIGPTGKTYPLNGAVPTQAVEQVIQLARSEGDAPASEESPNTDAVNPITEDDYIKGSRNAAVTIVEYSDFDCPFCSRFHDTMNQVTSKYDDVAWVYRHSPIDQLHPNARTVAVASECVGELAGNEAFWTFTDAYFASK